MRKIFIIIISFFTAFAASAAKVDTVNIYSAAMQKHISCVVITPDTYSKNAGKFPVLYLLHGHGGSFREWVIKAPDVIKSVDETGMIVVCPDGGKASWYLDAPQLPESKYETHVAKEVTNYIDKNYRTIQNRSGRAIAGLSMGGHGAMYLAIKHKEVYGACVALSAGVDFTPFPNNWGLPLLLGEYASNKNRWVAHTVQHLAHTALAGNELQIAIDCGVDDFFIGVNRILHQTLNELKIAHDYTERPGKHDWNYWNNAIGYQMYYLKKYFDKNNHKN